jgi:endonuclease V
MEKFILSMDEMEFIGYIFSDDFFRLNKVSDTPSAYFMDCEMVETMYGSVIAKIAIGTPFNHHVFTIKPIHAVTDYVTHITGLTKDTTYDMTYLELVEWLNQNICVNDILIGHHMYNDFNALKFVHKNVIDTALMFHHPDGPPHFYSLKNLAKMFLKKDIQNGVHDPIEDGITTFDLVKMYVDNGYVKTKWTRGSEILVPTIEIILEALGLDESHVLYICGRGSRVIGTHRPDSDYDIVVVCTNDVKIIEGTLTKCGNIDICIYSDKQFKKFIESQIIWSLECVYCPTPHILLKRCDYSAYAENYRENNTFKCNKALRDSIGYETARKISSSKRHFGLHNMKQSIKHIFIAFRFIDYGLQLLESNKIFDLTRTLCIWHNLLKLHGKIFTSHKEFEAEWIHQYIEHYKKFSKLVPKSMFDKDNCIDLCKSFSACSIQKNININMVMLKVLQQDITEVFLTECPDFKSELEYVESKFNEFINKMTSMCDGIGITNRKDFSTKIQQYDRSYHKYLFAIYDKKCIKKIIKNLNTKRLYNDIFIDKTCRIVAKYEPIPQSLWSDYQIAKAKEIITVSTFDSYATLRLIGGVDISFDKFDDSKACAYVAIYDQINKVVVYEDHAIVTLTVPYVSGFLGFREVPIYVELLTKLKVNYPHYYPHVLMVDGFGILHHRGFGSASHLGYTLNIPTIGVAKTLLHIDGLSEKNIKKEFQNTCKIVGDKLDLVGSSGKLLGTALKATSDTINPIYVSIGHMISLDDALKLVLSTCIFRIPEPIRIADIKSKLFF